MKTIKILFINFGKPAVRGGESQIVWVSAVSLYRERVVVARKAVLCAWLRSLLPIVVRLTRPRRASAINVLARTLWIQVNPYGEHTAKKHRKIPVLFYW